MIIFIPSEHWLVHLRHLPALSHLRTSILRISLEEQILKLYLRQAQSCPYRPSKWSSLLPVSIDQSVLVIFMHWPIFEQTQFFVFTITTRFGSSIRSARLAAVDPVNDHPSLPLSIDPAVPVVFKEIVMLAIKKYLIFKADRFFPVFWFWFKRRDGAKEKPHTNVVYDHLLLPLSIDPAVLVVFLNAEVIFHVNFCPFVELSFWHSGRHQHSSDSVDNHLYSQWELNQQSSPSSSSFFDILPSSIPSFSIAPWAETWSVRTHLLSQPR